MTKQEMIDAIKEDNPYMAEYIELYGQKELVSTFEKPAKFKTMEDFYKYCVKNKKKASELINIPKDAML